MTTTHVDVPSDFSQATGRIELNDDGIGYVESYDFSRANLSNESRIAAISTVASICYQSPKAAGSISLYNRLANESMGLPSSSFEFVPVLLKLDSTWLKTRDNHFNTADAAHFSKLLRLRLLNCFKYGESILGEDDDSYLLTNLRALMADVGDQADQFFNTEEECAIIAKHFKVYQAKIDIATRTQYIRHRVSWQELSRRYVSGKKSQFEFYISPKMQYQESTFVSGLGADSLCEYEINTTRSIIRDCVSHYDAAIANGVKPEEARRILPQNMYTTIWSAWQPSQLDSYLALRTDKHTQVEHRELAEAMKTLRNN